LGLRGKLPLGEWTIAWTVSPAKKLYFGETFSHIKALFEWTETLGTEEVLGSSICYSVPSKNWIGKGSWSLPGGVKMRKDPNLLVVWTVLLGMLVMALWFKVPLG